MMKLCGLCLVLAITTIAFAQDTDDCQTPDYEAGWCISVKSCPALISLLVEPLSQENLLFLQQSQCGYENGGPLVCCAQRRATVTTTRKPTVMSSRGQSVPQPNDVSRHRNIDLINADNCGSTTDNRIVGGNKTSIFEFPWMTLLSFDRRSGQSFSCGGSLISDQYVLTAAHCISKTKNLNLVSVRVGEHDTSTPQDCQTTSNTRVCAPPPQDIDIQNTFVHPAYSPRNHINDIALLRLVHPVEQKENVRPICLPVGLAEQTESHERKKLLVAGWGTTGTGISSSPDLLKVFLPVVPVHECHQIYSAKYRSRYDISNNQLCAGGNNLKQDSCQGDSGGPLTTVGQNRGEPRWIQYGIVSYGPKDCGTPGVPGVNTRVGHYMQWILDTMQT